MKILVKLVVVSVLLVSWIVVWYTRRPRGSSAPPTTNIHVGQIIKILFCVSVFLGAAGKEVVQQYYSSPVPEPQLGRTVASLGTDGGTVYITTEIDRLFSVCFAVCAVTFVGGMLWPSKNKKQDAKNRQSEREPVSSVCREAPASPASPTQPCSTRVIDQSERLDAPPETFAYYWQRRKWNRYGITAGVLAMTIGVWIDQQGALNWWPRIIMLGVFLWVLSLLIDYRTCIDKKRGIFEQQKLLFGRYRVGTVRLPLSEFIGVALDRYEDSEDRTNTFYVCLRRRNGRLLQACYFRVPGGQRSDEAAKAAQELAEMTGLKFDEASS